MSSKNVETCDEFFTTKELAKRWRCHIDTVKRRRRAGLIKGTRSLGRGFQFRLCDIRKYEEESLR